jgi:NADPH:quinone reductase-like Zn-dependent oxidoreductase
MRAVVIREHGGPEALRIVTDWPRPVAGAGEVVVQVQACALNHSDIFVREGWPWGNLPVPAISGSDIAGVVHSVGQGVHHLKPGERVLLDPLSGCEACEDCRTGYRALCGRSRTIGLSEPGGFAEFVKCRAAQIVPLPARLPFEKAACLPVAYSTAYRMVVTKAQVGSEDTVLVVGAGGGVAVAALQIAKLRGACVIAAVSTEEKLQRARQLGAHHVIHYTQNQEWEAKVRQVTGNRGVDVVIDSVGRTTWRSSVQVLAKRGRLVTCAATSGPIGQIDIRCLIRGEQQLLGSSGWTREELERVTSLAGQGRLDPVIDRVLPLERVAEGEMLLELRQVFGKIVVKV